MSLNVRLNLRFAKKALRIVESLSKVYSGKPIEEIALGLETEDLGPLINIIIYCTLTLCRPLC